MVTHLLVVRGQAGREIEDVACRLHGLVVVEQPVEIAGADVFHQLAALVDLLFEGFNACALVRIGLVGELLDVAQQCAEPGAVQRGPLTGEAVQESQDAGSRLRDFVNDLARLVPAGQEVLAGPFVRVFLSGKCAVGRAAVMLSGAGGLSAELLEEGVDVGVPAAVARACG